MLLFRLGGHVVVQQVRGTRLSLGVLGAVVSVVSVAGAIMPKTSQRSHVLVDRC